MIKFGLFNKQDYDSVVKIGKQNTRCYSPKMIKKLYPNGGYGVAGELTTATQKPDEQLSEKKRAKLETRRNGYMEIGEERFNTLSSGSKSKYTHRIRGYICVGENSFIAVKESLVPFFLMVTSAIAAIILALLLTFTLLSPKDDRPDIGGIGGDTTETDKPDYPDIGGDGTDTDKPDYPDIGGDGTDTDKPDYPDIGGDGTDTDKPDYPDIGGDETDPKETDAPDVGGETTEPKDTEPKDTEPKDTEPKDTEPKDTEPKDTDPDDPTPSVTDKPETEKPNADNGGGSVSLAYKLVAMVDPLGKNIQMFFQNPSNSTHDAELELYMVEDGVRYLISRSDRIPVGSTLEFMQLESSAYGIQSGIYNGLYVVNFYHPTTGVKATVTPEITGVNIYVLNTD